MNMPGFTAEASLFNGDMHYQATTATTVHGGVVRPALFGGRVSDIYVPQTPYLLCHLEYRCQIYDPVFGCVVRAWEYVC